MGQAEHAGTRAHLPWILRSVGVGRRWRRRSWWGLRSPIHGALTAALGKLCSPLGHG
uniref:Uncharacterized protein n=1 Tax=uncultured marine virus TaxID=186617 RepID=A0A0F7L3A6_9VIRU|nr:hypothetical protein [uncultured marine virus]